jgi:hypothetical protein
MSIEQLATAAVDESVVYEKTHLPTVNSGWIRVVMFALVISLVSGLSVVPF